MVNKTIIAGRLTADPEKRNVAGKGGDSFVAYNFNIANNDGYGDNEKTFFYRVSLFAKPGKQEEYYDRILTKGSLHVFTGRLTADQPYTNKDGKEITPWVLHATRVGNINQTVLTGHLTADATVTYKDDLVIVRFTIGVSRIKGDESDFIRVVKFGKNGFGDYADKYLKKGTAVCVVGREQTGSYTNRDGQKVYTQEVNAESIDLIGNKNSDAGNGATNTSTPKSSSTPNTPPVGDDGFMNIPDGYDDELPFN